MSETMPEFCPWCGNKECRGLLCPANDESQSPALVERARIVALLKKMSMREWDNELKYHKKGDKESSYGAYIAGMALDVAAKDIEDGIMDVKEEDID